MVKRPELIPVRIEWNRYEQKKQSIDIKNSPSALKKSLLKRSLKRAHPVEIQQYSNTTDHYHCSFNGCQFRSLVLCCTHHLQTPGKFGVSDWPTQIRREAVVNAPPRRANGGSIVPENQKLIKHFFIQEVFMLDFMDGLPIITFVFPARRSSIRGK